MKLQEKKMINSILFFANKSNNRAINRLKLMKLVWLADRIHLNKYGRTILKDKYWAMPNGPVPSNTFNFAKHNFENKFNVIGYNIISENEEDRRLFSESDIEVMEEVWKEYGNMDRFDLRDFSHFFPEWKRYKNELNNENCSNSFEIVEDDFFLAPDEKIKFDYNIEQSKLSKESYDRYNSVQNFLNA